MYGFFHQVSTDFLRTPHMYYSVFLRIHDKFSVFWKHICDIHTAALNCSPTMTFFFPSIEHAGTVQRVLQAHHGAYSSCHWEGLSPSLLHLRDVPSQPGWDPLYCGCWRAHSLHRGLPQVSNLFSLEICLSWFGLHILGSQEIAEHYKLIDFPSMIGIHIRPCMWTSSFTSAQCYLEVCPSRLYVVLVV